MARQTDDLEKRGPTEANRPSPPSPARSNWLYRHFAADRPAPSRRQPEGQERSRPIDAVRARLPRRHEVCGLVSKQRRWELGWTDCRAELAEPTLAKAAARALDLPCRIVVGRRADLVFERAHQVSK